MPRLTDDQIIETIRLYREALDETQALYVESGQLVRGSYSWLGGGEDPDAASIADQMNELHQGFLMKVFASAVPDASAKNMEQRQLGNRDQTVLNHSGEFICIVEGSIPTADNGVYGMVGGRTMLDIAQSVIPHA